MGDTNTRSCGGCTACCFTHSVARDGRPVTPMFEWCGHCEQGVGCSIYAERPYSCSVYRCAWLLQKELGEDKRPDRWGIILDLVTIPGEEKRLLMVWEAKPERLRDDDVKEAIKGLLGLGRYVISTHSVNGNELLFPADMPEADQVSFVTAAIRHRDERMRQAGA